MGTLNDGQIVEKIDGTIVSPKGFKATGIHASLKRKRLDLAALVCDVPASCAAVYTLNQVQAAPLKVTKESIAKEGKLRAIIVNSGNANACTGARGLEDAYEMRRLTAEAFSLQEHEVAVASTGVIGEFLPMEKITNGIQLLKPEANAEHAEFFSEAIMTTDTVKKRACFTTTINGETVTIAGTAKGSGMIHPNMATMLGFITTDANISSETLQRLLATATNKTFNRITVDGDTSTNDMVVVMASCLANHEELNEQHPEWEKFVLAFEKTAESLAKQIARDGEGATKLIEVRVSGAKNEEEAGQVAKQIVGSSLVKTAIFGTDANWGRIICAIGYSGTTIDPETIDISLGSIVTLKNSQPQPFSEEDAKAYLEGEQITIDVHLNVGEGFGIAWGCDLTYDYVRINAGYRT